MNQKKIKDETNAEDECSRNDCFNTQVKYRRHVDCTQKYRRNQKIQKIDDLQNNLRRKQENTEIQ